MIISSHFINTSFKDYFIAIRMQVAGSSWPISLVSSEAETVTKSRYAFTLAKLHKCLCKHTLVCLLQGLTLYH